MHRLARILGAAVFWYVANVLVVPWIFDTVHVFDLPKPMPGILTFVTFIAVTALSVRLAFFRTYTWVEKSSFTVAAAGGGTLLAIAGLIAGVVAAVYVIGIALSPFMGMATIAPELSRESVPFLIGLQVALIGIGAAGYLIYRLWSRPLN